MAEVSGGRALRPFPALDPEPPRRLTWRSLRWPAVACLAAAAVAAAFLIWPSSSPSASGPARAPFADRDGLVVFEQQPSGMLGTAAPDGSHLVTLRQIGALQGNDLPVAADDGRYLVNLEGQLVTMGPAGPTSVSDLADSAGQDATDQASSFGWADVSFADGGRYVVATACNLASQVSQSWVADLIPAAGGKGACSARSTDAVGDPQSAAAIVSGPVSSSAASSAGECYGPETAPDKAIELRGPGRAARTIVTAAELKGALGWPSATPVQLYRRSGPRREQAGPARRGGHPAGAASTAAGRRRDQPGRPDPGAHASPGGHQHHAMVTGRAADRLLPGQSGHSVQCHRLVRGPGSQDDRAPRAPRRGVQPAAMVAGREPAHLRGHRRPSGA